MAIKEEVRDFLNVSPFACVLLGDNLQIKYMNYVMTEFLSMNNEQESRGLSFINFFSGKDQKKLLNFLENQKFQQDNRNQWQLMTLVDKQSVVKTMLVSAANGLEISSGDPSVLIMGVPIDVDLFESTFGKCAPKDALNDWSYKHYEIIFNNASIGIVVMDSEGNIEDFNPIFTHHFGLPEDQIVNKHYTEIFKDHAKKSVNSLFDLINKTGEKHQKNVIIIGESEQNPRIVEISLSHIIDNNDKFDKYMMITEDITNQQDTHTALIQSEKLALTGRLAASLAHEINNPLQTSIGCLGLAEELLGNDDRNLLVYINMAMEELQRSARIVKRLRDLNRKADPHEKSSVDIQKVIDDVLILTKNRLYDRKIKPVFLYQGPPPMTYASKDQIQQVILNLIMNAIDSMPDGGSLFLDIAYGENSGGVKIKVRDTGVGMTSEQINRLFEPFQTTKEDGLGLGLYICKQIIDDHNGSLKVRSEAGKGTEFSLWLPDNTLTGSGS